MEILHSTASNLASVVLDCNWGFLKVHNHNTSLSFVSPRMAQMPKLVVKCIKNDRAQ